MRRLPILSPSESLVARALVTTSVLVFLFCIAHYTTVGSYEIELQSVVSLQVLERSQLLHILMAFSELLSSMYFYAAIFLGAGCLVGWSMMWRLMLLLFLVAYVCGVLKLVFHSPRPYWLSPLIKAIECGPDFGFPSGHSAASVVLFLFLAHVLGGEGDSRGVHEPPLIKSMPQWLMFSVAAVFAVITGMSRVYLGMHFPSQVVAGYAIGSFLLSLYLLLEQRTTVWLVNVFWKRGPGPVIGSIALFTLALALIPITAGRVVDASWSVPIEWEERAEAQCPRNTVAGNWGGAVLGVGADGPHISSAKIINGLVRMCVLLFFLATIQTLLLARKGFTVETVDRGGLTVRYSVPGSRLRDSLT